MRIQIPSERLLIHRLCIQLAFGDVLRHAFNRARHLIAAPIIKRNRQVERFAMCGGGLQLIHQLCKAVIKAHAVPNKPHPHIVLDHGVRLALNIV